MLSSRMHIRSAVILMGPYLCEVEWIVAVPFGLRLGHDLYEELPAGGSQLFRSLGEDRAGAFHDHERSSWEALGQHRHLGRAAEPARSPSSALSMQIRELERELKIDLVERRSGAIELTETDVEVARRREHVLAAARDLILLSAADVPRTAT
jgi:hypothetical protein